MYVHWKTLVVLGFTLWIVLCLTDILYDDYGSKKYLTSGTQYKYTFGVWFVRAVRD